MELECYLPTTLVSVSSIGTSKESIYTHKRGGPEEHKGWDTEGRLASVPLAVLGEGLVHKRTRGHGTLLDVTALTLSLSFLCSTGKLFEF